MREQRQRVKLSELIILDRGITTIGKRDINIDAAFKLSRLAKELQDIITTFQESRNTLVVKYGTIPEEDNKSKNKDDVPANEPRVEPGMDTWPAFVEELDKLVGIEETVNLVIFEIGDFGLEKGNINELLDLYLILEEKKKVDKDELTV